jgi:hypothetical protein
MASAITCEIVEILATMQAKALAFDRAHPDHGLATGSAAQYARAIQALIAQQEQRRVGELMLRAGTRAMRQLMLASTETGRPM